MSIVLNHKQIKLLYEMCGGEEATIRIEYGEGHSGEGYYACHDEYPEEGGEFLGKDESYKEDEEKAPN